MYTVETCVQLHQHSTVPRLAQIRHRCTRRRMGGFQDSILGHSNGGVRRLARVRYTASAACVMQDALIIYHFVSSYIAQEVK